MMEDSYVEWLVKRKDPVYAIPVKILMVIISAFSVLMALQKIWGVLLMLAAFAATYFVFINLSIEFEYLYADGDLYNFMNMDNYEQLAISSDIIGDALKFVKENELCKVCSYNGSVFSVEPPLFVELEVTETEPGFKGDTATGASKPATVETGATVSVPLFVEIGDKIKIDTRTGEYLSRV